MICLLHFRGDETFIQRLTDFTAVSGIPDDRRVQVRITAAFPYSIHFRSLILYLLFFFIIFSSLDEDKRKSGYIHIDMNSQVYFYIFVYKTHI